MMKVLLAIFLLMFTTAIIDDPSNCDYVSAWDERIPSDIPPEEIPKWISKNFDNLCGYFTEYGYFSTLFEMDAYLRWKYPEIYDSRIVDIAFIEEGKVNYTFFEWYWSDQEAVRAWLREIWNYPDDWRVIIPVSMKLYYEGGETVDALDRSVALTQELINKANEEYGGCAPCAAASDPIVKPTTSISMQLVAGILPAFYDNIAANYESLFGGGLGFASPAKDFLSSVIDLLKSVIDSVIAFLKSLF